MNNEKIQEKSVPITECMSRLMAWLCTKDKSCGDYQLCIVTGPNIDTAGKLIRRLQNTFERMSGIYFDNMETPLSWAFGSKIPYFETTSPTLKKGKALICPFSKFFCLVFCSEISIWIFIFVGDYFCHKGYKEYLPVIDMA